MPRRCTICDHAQRSESENTVRRAKLKRKIARVLAEGYSLCRNFIFQGDGTNR